MTDNTVIKNSNIDDNDNETGNNNDNNKLKEIINSILNFIQNNENSKISQYCTENTLFIDGRGDLLSINNWFILSELPSFVTLKESKVNKYYIENVTNETAYFVFTNELNLTVTPPNGTPEKTDTINILFIINFKKINNEWKILSLFQSPNRPSNAPPIKIDGQHIQKAIEEKNKFFKNKKKN